MHKVNVVRSLRRSSWLAELRHEERAEIIPKEGHTLRRLEAASEADPEAELVARAQRGEERAFEALFAAHKRGVYSPLLAHDS